MIAALEAQGDNSPECAAVRHDLRGRLATLQSALDVLQIAPAQSGLAVEAGEIARRHAAQLEQVLNELQGSNDGKRTDR